MSREHPQLRVRIPPELKEQLELKAKDSARTLTAEIVNRLEMSFLSESGNNVLMSAKQARELAELSRQRLPAALLAKATEAINRGIALGHTEVSVPIDEFELDGLDEETFEALLAQVLVPLAEAGYTAEVFDAGSIYVKF